VKIAYILGCNGSGKGRIVGSLRHQFELIEIDLFRQSVLGDIAPLLKGDEKNRWPIWDALIPRFNVVPVMASVLKDQLATFKKEKPLVIEGGLLAHRGFSSAFSSALRQIGYEFDEERRFWIDASPHQIHRNKTQHRRRKGEIGTTLDEVRSLVSWYRSKVRGLECERFAQVEDAIAAIDQYFDD
jgi:hypothetical protein